MLEEELITKAKEYEKTKRTDIEKALGKLKKFLKAYPFRDQPDDIDLLLTADKIYNPGDKNTFLYWIEFGLRDLGHIRVGSALYAENARDNPEKFKELLRIAVNASLSASQKIDAHWEDIKGFGGDKTIAKKIVFCYYPEMFLPVFKTDDLEHFANNLHINFQKEAYDLYGKSYEILTTGQKFEILNRVLIEIKNNTTEFKKWENILFTRFLYDQFPPQRIPPPTKIIKPLHPLGILFEPEYEQEVVYLFSVFHRELGFPYIIKIRNEFPDALVMDKKREVKGIEFEVRASDFIQHKHDKKGCDFIVCWENDLEGNEDLPPIIALKDFVEELK
jgi:hypothetical protein